MEERVLLGCVSEGGRLRVKIMSRGFPVGVNCQFPKAMREDGAKYTVLASAISVVASGSRKPFYKVKGDIKRVDDRAMPVYDVTVDGMCIICTDKPCQTVCVPCGHFFLCIGCSEAVHRCAICRQPVTQLVMRDDLA